MLEISSASPAPETPFHVCFQKCRTTTEGTRFDPREWGREKHIIAVAPVPPMPCGAASNMELYIASAPLLEEGEYQPVTPEKLLPTIRSRTIHPLGSDIRYHVCLIIGGGNLHRSIAERAIENGVLPKEGSHVQGGGRFHAWDLGGDLKVQLYDESFGYGPESAQLRAWCCMALVHALRTKEPPCVIKEAFVEHSSEKRRQVYPRPAAKAE